MPVRLKVRVRRETGKGIITSAVVNTYFASDEPLLLVPFKTAEKLGLEGARMEEFEVAGGGTVSGLRLKGPFELEVVLKDRQPRVSCEVSTIREEREAIISDRLASDLQIVILDPAKGEWCFRDEIGRKVRKS